MNVKLYALSTCPYCKLTKKFLEENSVEFETLEVDLLEEEAQDADVEKVREISGGASFPVVVIGEEVIVGFNKKRIKELLEL